MIFLRDSGKSTWLLNTDLKSIRSHKVQPNKNYGIVFRYRSDTEIISDLEVNSIESVRKLSNKYKAIKTLEENNIRVPFTTNDKSVAREFLLQNPNNILLGRKYYHFGGVDIVTIRTELDLTSDRSDYWQQYIKKDRELRIFVLYNRVLIVNEKIIENKEQIAWNHSQGSTFEYVNWSKWISKACYFSVLSSKIFDIDWCAYDLIIQDGTIYMLEGNTAPQLNGGYNLSTFKKGLEWIESQYQLNKSISKSDVLPFVKGYRNYIHPCLIY